MSGKSQLTKDPVWQKIFAYFTANGTKINIKELFDKDPKRFEKYRYQFFSSFSTIYKVDLVCVLRENVDRNCPLNKVAIT